MNTKTRVLAALLGGRVDRPPVTGIVTAVTQEMMREFDASWPDAHQDPELMARLGAAGHLMYGLETVKVPFDVVVETEALGAEVSYGDANVFPQVREPTVQDPAEVRIPENLFARGRFPVVLGAIALLRERYGAEVTVVSHGMGPFSLSSLLFGASEFLVWMALEPEKYHRAMELATEIASAYARAQIIAGSDVVQFGEAAASGSMISPADYAGKVAPYHRKLARAVAAPTVLHICGNITDRLQAIADTGASAISFDETVDMAVARRILRGRMAMVGNVPIQALATGTPGEVETLSRQALADGIDLLNAGCSLAPATPGANIRRMVAAARGSE